MPGAKSAGRQTTGVHAAVIGALMMREVTTRFGRENLGFLWIVLEPLMFALGVMAFWLAVKPPYEHGIPVAAFSVTGYMPVLLLRHFLSRAVQAIRSNVGLLFHRQVTVLHVVAARLLVEFVGTTLAFVVAAVVLNLLGLMELPANYMMVYVAWGLLAWFALGLAMVFCAISEMSELAERLLQPFNYLIMPISGAFFMVAWLPSAARDLALLVPIVSCIEMLRAGFFGDGIETHYNAGYVVGACLVLTFAGLSLLDHVRRNVDIA